MTVDSGGTSLAKRVVGWEFSDGGSAAGDIFTPEDFSEEQRQVASTAASFAEEKILAKAEAIEAKDFAVTRALMCEAG